MTDTDKTVMKFKPPEIEITGKELGRTLAEMGCDDQAVWMLSFAKVTDEFVWCMQCRMIVDLLTDEERSASAGPLEVLIGHLRERFTRTFALRPILARERLPDVDVTVIVQGGIAAWDGVKWCSRMHGDFTKYDTRPIQWPVLWWMPFPTDETALDVSERPQPPCGV